MSCIPSIIKIVCRLSNKCMYLLLSNNGFFEKNYQMVLVFFSLLVTGMELWFYLCLEIGIDIESKLLSFQKPCRQLLPYATIVYR